MNQEEPNKETNVENGPAPQFEPNNNAPASEFEPNNNELNSPAADSNLAPASAADSNNNSLPDWLARAGAHKMTGPRSFRFEGSLNDFWVMPDGSFVRVTPKPNELSGSRYPRKYEKYQKKLIRMMNKVGSKAD